MPARQSAFLWGPRKTGKSTYLRSAFPDSLTFDLLQTDLMLELAKRPALLRERLLATPPEKLRSPVILDEIQKVPRAAGRDLRPGMVAAVHTASY